MSHKIQRSHSSAAQYRSTPTQGASHGQAARSQPPAPAHSSSTHAKAHQGHSVRDSFDRINRNDKDGHIDVSDLVAAHAKLPQDPGKIRGDKNGDNRLNFEEYKAAYKKATKKKSESHGSPKPTQEHHVSYHVSKNGQSATLRTHASGLVDGRVNPGDTFVASHKKGQWLYGHVKGHPERKGWVLAPQLAQKGTTKHTPTAAERHEGTRHSVDARDRSNFEYLDGKDKKALQYLQGGLSSQVHERVGYTTPVKAKDPSKPIKVYSNLSCRPGDELKRGGKPVEIPAGADVKFRYTPDGKHAVVLADSGSGGKSGTWGIVPLSQLNIPKGTPGTGVLER